MLTTMAVPTRHLPRVIAWNLTTGCNQACAHCYMSARRGRGEELGLEECQRIADEILALQPSPMFVLSGGEPLTWPHLEELAEHCTRGGATVVIGTNGTLLTGARIESLARAGVQGFALSVDSLDPAVHDRFRGTPGALDQVLAAVSRLQEAGLPFVIQSTLGRGTRRELAALVAWARAEGAFAFNLYLHVETGRGRELEALSASETEETLAELVELERQHRGAMLVRAKCLPQFVRLAHAADPETPVLDQDTRCPAGLWYCRITPAGRLTPCPYLPAEVGDLRASSFGELWGSSPLLASLREGSSTGRCGSCAYVRACGGCRARAAAEGELRGPDPSCPHEPDGRQLPEQRELLWDPVAEARISRLPAFARQMARSRIEARARREGLDTVDSDWLDDVMAALPFQRPGRPAP